METLIDRSLIVRAVWLPEGVRLPSGEEERGRLVARGEKSRRGGEEAERTMEDRLEVAAE